MAATLSAGVFIAAILVLLPSPSHWRARNVATLALIAWLFVVDLIYGVNTIVWAGNVEVRIVVWCDITTKIIIGASSALPAAAMCICKHLHLVASGRTVRLTHEDRRRRMWFELAMCFGVPMVLMALHYIVQGHRFDIIEDIGCQPATYYSIPAVFIVWFPPLLFATFTFIYAGLALHHFFRQRASFATHLQSCDSALTTSRYLRLIAISITEMVWGTSLTAFAMYDNISPGLFPYVSWAYVHAGFSRIGQYALVEFTPGALQHIFLLFWAIPASSFVFFVFFGFGEEATKDYRSALAWFARRVLRIPAKPEKWHPACRRPSPGTATLSAYSSPSTEFSDDKAFPAYTPRDTIIDIGRYTPLFPDTPRTPAPPSPARMEAGTYHARRTSEAMLSDADLDLDELLARCPSISTGVPSPNSPVEFGHRIEGGTPVAVPSPAYRRSCSPPASRRSAARSWTASVYSQVTNVSEHGHGAV
ncbi:hypothetical protein EVJ58_g7330 [Rhodofomes roseus]|uniref:Uncharacterized protein n=1 Tax=Rhodofomes roseus TaxID=34475 RepID=A0A4Y9Y407_9APHY|nr:hypothetical protein EVJ58_g7330 [Rhodofomes roseus]